MSDRDITLREFVEHGIEHMEVLRVEPGDVCVIRSEEALSDQAVSLINEAWRRIFTERAAPKLIILDCGMSLGVLRPNAQTGPEEVSKAMPPGSTSPEPGRLSPIPAVGASDEGAGDSSLGPHTQRKGVGLEQACPAPTSETNL